jgi:hypothetical protein
MLKLGTKIKELEFNIIPVSTCIPIVVHRIYIIDKIKEACFLLYQYNKNIPNVLILCNKKFITFLKTFVSSEISDNYFLLINDDMNDNEIFILDLGYENIEKISNSDLTHFGNHNKLICDNIKDEFLENKNYVSILLKKE